MLGALATAATFARSMGMPLAHWFFRRCAPQWREQRGRRVGRRGDLQHPPTTRAHNSPAIMIPRHTEYEPTIRANITAPSARTFQGLGHPSSLRLPVHTLQALPSAKKGRGLRWRTGSDQITAIRFRGPADSKPPRAPFPPTQSRDSARWTSSRWSRCACP